MQLYDSALLFSPQQSKIRQNFDTEAPISIEMLCPSFQKWDTCLLTITGVYSDQPSLGVTPDGTKLATIGEDRVTILILDSLTGDHLGSFQVNDGGILLSVSFHPDGKHLVSLSIDQKIRIWDIVNQKCLHYFLKGSVRPFTQVVGMVDYTLRLPFSTDGRLLALSSGYEAIELWDVWKRVCLRTFYHHDSHREEYTKWFDWGLSQSNIPLLLVVKYIHKLSSVQIDIWHAETGQQLLNSAEIRGHFRAAVIRPDRQQLTVATEEGISIARWDADITVQKVIGQSSIGLVNDMTWAVDGKSLAIATESGIVLWDLEKQEELLHIFDHSTPIATLHCGKGNLLASISYNDHTLKIWSVELNADLPVSVEAVTSSLPVAFEQGPNGNLGIVREVGDMEVLNVFSGNTHRLSRSASEVLWCKFGPEQHYFTVLTTTGIAEIWDLASGDCKSRFQIYDQDFGQETVTLWPAAITFGAPGRIVTIGRKLKVWNPDTGTSMDISHSFEEVHDRYCACSRDGRLAYNLSEFQVAVWGCDWANERQYSMEVFVLLGLSFNSNGLLMINNHHVVEIWNCEDGTIVRQYIIPEMITNVGWDLRYQSGLDTEFGIIDLDVEEEEEEEDYCRKTSFEATFELPWCPRSLRLAWTEKSAWLMKGRKRVLWIPRESLSRRLFSVRTDPETGMSTVVMLHNGHIMILRISVEH